MSGTECAKGCWIAGGILGLLVLLFTAGIGDLGFFGGVFLGAVAAAMFAKFLIWGVCEGKLPEEPVVAPEPAPVRAAPAPQPVKPVAEKAAEKPAEKPVEQPVAKPVPVAPEMVAAPDDLKLIKGVGPKLEAWLHDHGITRFDQIAIWTEAEIDRHAEGLGRLGGRIRAEDWVGQARALMAGKTAGKGAA